MDIRLSEVVSALSCALDVTEGQPMGHAVRSCAIGMRIGEEIGLDDDARSSLFYALLLKDAGCWSNAAKLSALFGADDLELKRARKLTNHLRPFEALKYTVRYARTRRLAAIVRSGAEGARDMTELRCQRGAQIARIAVSVGDVLGLSSRQLRDLRRMALLHDIGKLGVSNLVLDKPGKLTDEEWTQMRRHPELTARILAVADVCEALTADRPYRKAMEPDQVRSIMRGDVGKAFCHEALGALEETRELAPVATATPALPAAPRAAR